MKTTTVITFALLTVLLVPQGTAQDLTSNLVAHYPLDGSAVDVSGNGFDGVFNGTPAYTADRFGNAAGAASFDGASRIGTNFAPVYNTTDPLTVSLWLRCDVSTLNSYVVGFERTNHQEVTIRVMPDGTVRMQFRDDDWHSGNVTSTVMVTDDTWHHVVGVRDVAADELRIYVDGVLEDTETDVTLVANNANATLSVALGGNNHSSGNLVLPYVGALDDVRFYDRVLDDAEIQALGAWNDLLAYWPFNNTTDDESGNGYHGTAYGGAFTADRFCTPNSAYHFDGNAHILTTFEPTYTQSNAVTASVWINIPAAPPNAPPWAYVMLGYERSDHQELSVSVRPDGTAGFYFRDDDWNANQVISTATVTDGFWHHIVAVRVPETNELKLYIDGVFEAEATDVTTGINNAVARRAMSIGAVNNSTFGFIKKTVGDIDDIRIYHRVLSDEEITALFTEGSELLPTVDAGGVYQVDEGGSVLLTASGTDPNPNGGALSYAWDLNGDGIFETEGQSVSFSSAGLDGPSTHPVVVRATNACGLRATGEAEVEVDNVAPVIESITAPIVPLAVGTEFTADASFTDAGVPDTHTADWDWGDDTTSPGTVTEANGSGTATGTHTYDMPGVYTLTLTVTDDDGGSGDSVFQYVVVYDPEGGFVTGGGWINSPEGAYVADPTLTGKAHFGFVAKYMQGQSVPEGKTDFRFKTADVDFRSTSYDWLVATHHKATYKGVGTINDEGSFGFQITAIDADLTPSINVDLFRIKIWDKANGDALIYDSQVGETDEQADPTTQIGGGNIKIQSSGAGKTGVAVGAAPVVASFPTRYELRSNYPNPFNPSTEISFDLPEAVHARLAVYDVTGRLVMSVVDTTLPAGSHRVLFDASALSSGVYLYRLTAGSFTQTRRMVLAK